MSRDTWLTTRTNERTAARLGEEAQALHEEFEKRSIFVLERDSEKYPAKLKHALGENAPPELFAIGNMELLLLRPIAIVGSRHCSRKGLDLTSKLSGILAAKGFN